MSKINLQESQRNLNATANFVNLIRASTVSAQIAPYAQIAPVGAICVWRKIFTYPNRSPRAIAVGNLHKSLPRSDLGREYALPIRIAPMP